MNQLNQKQKLVFSMISFCFLLFGVAGGLAPRIFIPSQDPLEGQVDWQLAQISYQFAVNKDYQKSQEAALAGLKQGYTRPAQAHWFLSQLAWLESQQGEASEAVHYYKDLVNLRGLALDQANYVWALSRSEAREKSPKTAQEALEALVAAQQKITELALELQKSPDEFAGLQLAAWRSAKRVETLILRLEQPES